MRPLARAQEEAGREADPAVAPPAPAPPEIDRTSPDLTRPPDPDVSARLEARLIPA